jgi:hypothetical protein
MTNVKAGQGCGWSTLLGYIHVADATMGHVF